MSVSAGASVIVPFSAIDTPRASPLMTSSCFEISQKTGPTAIAKPHSRARIVDVSIIDLKAVLIRAGDLYMWNPFIKWPLIYLWFQKLNKRFEIGIRKVVGFQIPDSRFQISDLRFQSVSDFKSETA